MIADLLATGGVVFSFGQGLTASISSSRFFGNKAGGSLGGALAMMGETLTLSNSSFENNTAKGSGGAAACEFQGALISIGKVPHSHWGGGEDFTPPPQYKGGWMFGHYLVPPCPILSSTLAACPLLLSLFRQLWALVVRTPSPTVTSRLTRPHLGEAPSTQVRPPWRPSQGAVLSPTAALLGLRSSFKSSPISRFRQWHALETREASTLSSFPLCFLSGGGLVVVGMGGSLLVARMICELFEIFFPQSSQVNHNLE